MKYSVDKQNRYTVLTLHENHLNDDIARDLKQEMITTLHSGVLYVILDIKEVDDITEEGLSTLLSVNHLFMESGGMFVVCGAHGSTERLFFITHIQNILHIVPSLDEAIEDVHLAQTERERNLDAEG